MLESDFISLIKKLIESDTPAEVLKEVIKALFVDLEPDPDYCVVCDDRDRYD